jgi:MFS family permease
VPRLRFYYGWVNLVVAVLAMVATLPGRTHGLGLVTEPLLRDLGLDRVLFGWINLVATFLGAVFALPTGWLVDRFGTRAVLTGVTAALGAVVLCMARVEGAASLFATVTLSRGLGQGALSVVSLAVVSKWFDRRLRVAMGVYAALVALGFMAAFPAVGAAADYSWRLTWSGIGLALLLGLAPLGWLLVRSTPEECGVAFGGGEGKAGVATDDGPAYTLGQALRTPAFWVFALGSALFLLVSSSTSLFGESILAERGFSRATFLGTSAVAAFAGLLSNFLSGWLTTRWPIGRSMGVALFLLTGALLALPVVRTGLQVYLYAAALGASGGIVTVVFFAFWGHAYGRASVGAITGAAQALTVVGSGLGQLLPALCQRYAGSYAPLFYALAPGAALLGVFAWLVPLPARRPLPPTGKRNDSDV